MTKCAKFHHWETNIKQDIHIQKINVEKLVLNSENEVNHNIIIKLWLDKKRR